MITLQSAKSWIADRLKERTSWDGLALVAAGAAFIILGPLAQVAAYAAIVYGGWTFWKKEVQKSPAETPTE